MPFRAFLPGPCAWFEALVYIFLWHLRVPYAFFQIMFFLFFPMIFDNLTVFLIIPIMCFFSFIPCFFLTLKHLSFSHVCSWFFTCMSMILCTVYVVFLIFINSCSLFKQFFAFWVYSCCIVLVCNLHVFRMMCIFNYLYDPQIKFL